MPTKRVEPASERIRAELRTLTGPSGDRSIRKASADSGVGYATLHAFIKGGRKGGIGGSVDAVTLDRLIDYLGYKLVRKA